MKRQIVSEALKLGVKLHAYKTQNRNLRGRRVQKANRRGVVSSDLAELPGFLRRQLRGPYVVGSENHRLEGAGIFTAAERGGKPEPGSEILEIGLGPDLADLVRYVRCEITFRGKREPKVGVGVVFPFSDIRIGENNPRNLFVPRNQFQVHGRRAIQ